MMMKHKIIKQIVKNENGQSIVLVALLMVVIMVFAALVVDLGMVSYTKTRLQNAADAAALAGAQDLPAATATTTAETYAVKNRVLATEVKVTYPDANKIKVVCTRNYSYSFARIFGYTNTDVIASAVAQNGNWDGNALPFLNIYGDGEDSSKGLPLTAWNMVYPGVKERIKNDDLDTTTGIKVKYEDGSIAFKEGLDMSKVKVPLQKILVVGNTVYMISLKHSEMLNYAPNGSKELGNNAFIPCIDTVLLKCEVTDAWDGTGSDVISLKFIESYAWDASKNTYLSATGNEAGVSINLVE
ncbi:pilus assembly protein TadG-related protein [Acetobacterium sp.]|uniref:pilus assembly protein TadG-related protein n=1 Tax=Acetobacterium sp. TaxID=1872094 RepID=UPI002F41AF8D